MSITIRLFFILVFGLVLSAPSSAQIDPDDFNTLLDEMDSTQFSFGNEISQVEHLHSGNLAQDSALTKKYAEAIEAYYQYRIDGYGHRQKVFNWQLFSTKIIFIVVTLLVMAGIYFSGIQFHHGLKNNLQEVTELEASTGGIKVSSPILGVIILVISFLFFYLYLVHIYPIQEIF